MRKLVLSLFLLLVLATPALAAAPFASMTDTTGQMTGVDISTSLVYDSNSKVWMLETPTGFQEYPADRFLVTFFFEGPTVVGPHGDLGFMLEDGVAWMYTEGTTITWVAEQETAANLQFP